MSWNLFLLVVALGVLQLAVGVVFGRCLPLRSRHNRTCDGRTCRLSERIKSLLARVSEQIGDHQEEVRRADRQLRTAQEENPTGLSDVVLGTVAHLLHINEQLQHRLAAAEERLQEQSAKLASHIVEARTDPLTGLPNRRAFDDELTRSVARWQRRHVPFAVAMVDMDHFKRLNDRHGHLAGDQALRLAADVLRREAGDEAVVARVGGEEFAVLLPHASSFEAQQVAAALREAVANEPLLLDDSHKNLNTTVSVGLAVVQEGDDAVTIVRRADEALYAAKRAGRNCAFFHNDQKATRIETEEAGEIALEEICQELQQRVADVLR
ncbi:MAG: GGDEF domain-containing protein [Planctomycetota bacterium]